MFKKIEVWIILLMLLFFGIAAVLFGTTIYLHQQGSTKVGFIGPIATEIAKFPIDVI